MINSPHPATFLRELQHSPAQQAASAYMNFLCRPDAEALLAENDFARLWPFFTDMGAADEVGRRRVADRFGTEQYRARLGAGLERGCNYYRASPLRPPTASNRGADLSIEFPPESVTVKVPTRVVWAEDDVALPVALLDGLEAYVPEHGFVRVPGATHWIIHERPAFIAHQIEEALRTT